MEEIDGLPGFLTPLQSPSPNPRHFDSYWGPTVDLKICIDNCLSQLQIWKDAQKNHLGRFVEHNLRNCFNVDVNELEKHMTNISQQLEGCEEDLEFMREAPTVIVDRFQRMQNRHGEVENEIEGDVYEMDISDNEGEENLGLVGNFGPRQPVIRRLFDDSQYGSGLFNVNRRLFGNAENAENTGNLFF